MHDRDPHDDFPLILSTNAVGITEGSLQVPLSREFPRVHPDVGRIKIPFPARLEGKTVKEVRILPMEKARFFTVPFVQAAEEERHPRGWEEGALARDRGLDHRATCGHQTEGSAFILDGKTLKSMNHLSKGRMAKLPSALDQQTLPRSAQRARIPIHRHHQVRDDLMKFARAIMNCGLDHAIGTLGIGYPPDGKHGTISTSSRSRMDHCANHWKRLVSVPDCTTSHKKNPTPLSHPQFSLVNNQNIILKGIGGLRGEGISEV